MFSCRKFPSAILLVAVPLWGGPLSADPVAAEHKEGPLHAFLAVRDVNSKIIGTAEVSQVRKSGHMVTRVVFRLKDGSLLDETTTFSQRDTFRLISDRVIQKGPSFKLQMESILDAPSGQFTAKYQDEHGKQREIRRHLDVPADVCNGLIWTLLKNVDPGGPTTTVSMVSASPKPRLVRLRFTAKGESVFSIAGTKRKATHFIIKTELTGPAKLVAPLVGKHPPEMEGWVLEDKVPTVFKFRGPLYEGGPVWQIEPAGPAGPQPSPKSGGGLGDPAESLAVVARTN